MRDAMPLVKRRVASMAKEEEEKRGGLSIFVRSIRVEVEAEVEVEVNAEARRAKGSEKARHTQGLWRSDASHVQRAAVEAVEKSVFVSFLAVEAPVKATRTNKQANKRSKK